MDNRVNTRRVVYSLHSVARISLGICFGLFVLCCSGSKSSGGKSGPGDTSNSRAVTEQVATEKRPNVVVMLLDTLRPDYLGAYGADPETAPFLGKLADGSAVFEQALSTSSWTAPATASLFTSLYPPQHTVIQGFKAHRAQIAKLDEEGASEIQVNHIPKDIITLPEMFKRAGYRTFGISANINIGKEIGFDRGFDRFERDVRAPAESVYKMVEKWRPDIVQPDTSQKDNVQKKPFLLYLHLNDAHQPYNKRHPYYRGSEDPMEDAMSRYRSEIRYMDGYLEKIWQLPWIQDNTVLLVVSDHGEEFGDHGGTEHGPTLYYELNHVVMMMNGPSVGISPLRVSENVSLVDVMPTLASLAGIETPSSREGISLAPLFRKPEAAAKLRGELKKRFVFGHRKFSTPRKLSVWSVTEGHLKLVDWWGERRKLFDHRTDPEELSDLSEKKPSVTKRLQKRIDQFKIRMDRGSQISSEIQVPLNKTLLDQLQTLGYVEK